MFRMKRILLLMSLLLVTAGLSAQVISVASDAYAIALQVDALKRLETVYFGPKLADPADYAAIGGQLGYRGTNEDFFNHAYTPAGTWNVAEPALEIAHADGNPSTELSYVAHQTQTLEPGVSLTTIDLIDSLYQTRVTLFYKVYAAQNVFEQWATIRNGESGPIMLKKYASANLYFRHERFFLTQYHGSWAEEMQPETHELTAGIKVLDSKLGTRSHLYGPPTFRLEFDQPATEETGKVLLANLAWSGNFRFEFERDRHENLRLIAGANAFAAEYQLQAGESFETPHFIYTYSEQGRGAASRQLHRWARQYRLYDGEGERLTLLNNWEATYFDFDEEKLVELFDGAAELGVDLFLLDDGWFANKYPRNSDGAGLGDWTENREKLPHGLGYLVKEANQKGVQFGIWIEPEMVNPKSELYENHLDWVIRQPDRREFYYRNQLVLDLTNPEVQDYVYGVFDRIFTENPGIAYVKWDCNAIIYNAFSDYLDRVGRPQTHLYTDYVRGLYAVLERVRAKYPEVPIMLCSGGGGRVDYGALQYFTEFWVSDNTAPLDRVYMQWDYSYFYPAIAMCAHVTNWDRTASLKYRTDVASMGKLGFDIEVDELSEADLAFCQQAVRNYKAYSDILWKGEMYRLQSPYEHPYASFQFVDPAQARSVMFSYLVSRRYETSYAVEPVRLQGLDPAKRYRVTELNLYPEARTPFDGSAVYSGDFLMKVGINPAVTAWRQSVVLQIEAVE